VRAYEIPTGAIAQMIAKRAEREERLTRNTGAAPLRLAQLPVPTCPPLRARTKDDSAIAAIETLVSGQDIETTGRVFRSPKDIADAMFEYRRRHPMRGHE